jgi:hypothetical protein
MAETLDHGLYRHRSHAPSAGAIPVPHGPETGEAYETYPYTRDAASEEEIFKYVLKPDDSYTPEGVYWADLSPWQRTKFVASTDAQEAKRELGEIGKMMKEDPLSPVGWYFRHAVLPGAGLGLEGYVFSRCGDWRRGAGLTGVDTFSSPSVI